MQDYLLKNHRGYSLSPRLNYSASHLLIHAVGRELLLKVALDPPGGDSFPVSLIFQIAKATLGFS